MYKRVIMLLFITLVSGLQQYEADFLMFDSNGDSLLHYDEIKAQFPQQNQQSTSDFVVQFFADYDANGDKIIDLTEYQNKRKQQQQELENQQQSIGSLYHDDL